MTPLAYQSQSHLQNREIGNFTSPRWDSTVSMNTAATIPRSCQSPQQTAVEKQTRGRVHHWILGGVRNDSQRGTYLSGHSHPRNPYCLALHEPC